MQGLTVHRGRAFVHEPLLFQSQVCLGTCSPGPAAVFVQLVAKPLPLRLARFGGGLSDPLALTCDAMLGVREASFATAPHAIGSCVAFEQGDLT